jgi:broad specificity polyphosphatase/5'/3'-nucleotidase SurE
LKEDEPDSGSDVHAVLENRISVTPVHLDLTAPSMLEKLRAWRLD